MGRSKNKFKHDKLLTSKGNWKNCPLDLGVNVAHDKSTDPKKTQTDLSDKYGIRHLLKQTKESGQDINPHPKCIDLCDEEVIDLTERSANEPTVIDISEEGPSGKSENDDVCVIGIVSKARENPFSKKDVFEVGLGESIKHRKKIAQKLSRVKTKNGQCNMKRKKKKMGNKCRELRKWRVIKDSWCNIGSNVYMNSPIQVPPNGLRPIIIDGNNVAYVHSNFHFSCKRLEMCINYFKEKGHKVTAFVPQFRMSHRRNDDPTLLKKLEREGYVVLTPSKEVDGRKIIPYDDRFIVQTAALQGGVIVSRDNYKDLLEENPTWAETIKYRTLAYTWVGDVLMFPEDPLGEYGPKLEEFLRFH